MKFRVERVARPEQNVEVFKEKNHNQKRKTELILFLQIVKEEVLKLTVKKWEGTISQKEEKFLEKDLELIEVYEKELEQLQ